MKLLVYYIEAERQGTELRPAPCPARNTAARGGSSGREEAGGRELGRRSSQWREGRRTVVQRDRHLQDEPGRIYL